MDCGNCEKEESCNIDFRGQLSSLRAELAQLRAEGDGVIADTDPRLDQLLSMYPVCVQLALAELNFTIGRKKLIKK